MPWGFTFPHAEPFSYSLDWVKDFAAQCAEIANMDKSPKLEGRNMSMFLSPKPQTAPKKPAKPKAPKSAPDEAPAAEPKSEDNEG